MGIAEDYVGKTIAAFIPGPKGQIKISGKLLRVDENFLEIEVKEKGLLGGSKTKTAVLSMNGIAGFWAEEE